ncbi:hypothetical protein A3A69_00820 [candidate division WWE3 bacterium RIFCSPLOWO2_01_FULL_37_15]|uniref:CBM-cenC domain-containing protein n=1 Tax=candidate division WWE3 bacterium RIFCSPLOWO2_01_FULL_37_15 TaxID=1802622 RepID=A0A1F4UVA2_UNCKA|nr:MAG: hypothetical protein A3A69_00820 [candidate division WWE3 bacterium RIFCSPLOWO2_01_FULL_37_15]
MLIGYSSSAHALTEYLKNGNFDIDLNSDYIPDFWLKSSNSTSSDSLVYLDGSNRYRFFPVSTGYKSLTQSLWLTNGGKFSVRAQVKTQYNNPVGNLRMKLDYFKDGISQGYSYVDLPSAYESTTWKTFTINNINPNKSFNHVKLSIENSIQIGYSYFNGVSLFR